jgi:hypothetical protein
MAVERNFGVLDDLQPTMIQLATVFLEALDMKHVLLS